MHGLLHWISQQNPLIRKWIFPHFLLVVHNRKTVLENLYYTINLRLRTPGFEKMSEYFLISAGERESDFLLLPQELH